MSDYFLKLNGKIDRRSPQDEGDPVNPVVRENWLSRDGKLSKPPGHEAVITGLADLPRWMARYHTIESGNLSPKTFTYTEDGKIYVSNDQAGTATVVKENLNQNAYPRHWLFKTTNQTKLFLVDGLNLYGHDGNNNNTFLQVSLSDADGNPVKPIDVIEHKDRLLVLSKTSLYVSKNLDPENFTDADDSIEIIVGSGKGTNLAFGKIEDRLYVFNTEGIFILEGDVISALAATFEVRLVEDRRIIAGRTAFKVEKAIIFLADDFELWSWDGSQTQMLSFELKLKDFINPYRDMLDKAVATYHDNYYKMSFVETGEAEPNIEIWWDAFEDKIEVVRGRHVSCYMKTDPTVEQEYVQFGQSNANTIMQDNRGSDFNGAAIRTRLRSRDIVVKKGHNVRFLAFYPQFMPTGNRNIEIRYLLDGRSSNPSGANAIFTQNLRGEVITLGSIGIPNQSQAMGRIRPKINYARGESIAFEIIEETLGLNADLIGIGIDFIAKFKSKGVTIGA